MANSKKNRSRARRVQAREVAAARRHRKRVRWISAVLVGVLAVGIVGFALTVALTSSTSEEAATTTTLPPSPCPEAEAPPVRETSLPAPSYEDDPVIDPSKTYTAVMKTSCGDMTFALDAATAPVDVNNFVYLAQQGFYEGILFHRVLNGFVIQAGDPTASDQSRAGSGGPGYEYTGSTPTPPADGSNTYKVGSLAMANSSDPSSNGSQFFVVSGPQGESLPPNYSLFGQMTQGQDVLDKIQSVPTVDENGYPVTPVVLETVTIQES